MSVRVDLSTHKDEVQLELSCEMAFVHVGGGVGVCL
jgi:hypothetical protein